MSVRRACAAVYLAPSSFYYRARPRDDTPAIEALNALVGAHPRDGFWMCRKRLRAAGHPWNHKRIYRVYCTLRVFRTFNIVDDFAREALAIEIDTSLPAARVVRVLENLVAWRGLPRAIRCDNGPEFLAQGFVAWCRARAIEIRYIQPGKPNQNAFIERFNRTFRRAVLDLYLFEDLDQVREEAHRFLIDYNEQRPHDSLKDLPSTVYRRQYEAHCSTSEVSG
jgi:putative transposase